MLDLWLLWFSASYSTLAQFMMNYGNEWDMDLILSYVGTQIWGTAENHVLLLTSRKSCLVTSRGKLVHAGNTGWDVEGARLPALVARAKSEPGLGCFGLSWCAILWLNCCTARLRRLFRGVGSTRGHSEVNDHCGKNQRAPLNNTTSDMLRVQSLRAHCTEIIRSESVMHVMMGDECK